MAAPVIPAIATQNIVINDTTEFVLNIDVTGATSCIIEGDLEGFYATFDRTLSSNRLKLKGIPDRLLSDKVLTITATNANDSPASVSTQTFVYHVVPAAPIITRPTGRIKFVRGAGANLFIPVANQPGHFNAAGLQVGLAHKLEETGGRIIGAIPNETQLVAASGLMDLEASNGGGVDTENAVPFDILTTEPSFTTFTVTAGYKSITFNYTKPTDARRMEAKLWKSTETEPPDSQADAWHDVGTGNSGTLTRLEGATYNCKMRVGSPWVGTKTSVAQTVTPYSQIAFLGYNGTLKVYDLETRQETSEITGLGAQYACGDSIDDRVVFYSPYTNAGNLQFYDRGTLAALTTENISVGANNPSYRRSLATDTRFLAYSAYRRYIHFYNRATRSFVSSETITLPSGTYTGRACVIAGDRLIVASRGKAYAYNIKTRARVTAEDMTLPSNHYYDILVTADRLIFLDNSDNKARYYHRQTRAAVTAEDITLPPGNYYCAVATPDRFIFVDSQNDKARFYHRQTRAAVTAEDITLPSDIGDYNAVFLI